jgi:hypothetical protein
MDSVAVESPAVANASARVRHNGIRGAFRAERAGEPGAAIPSGLRNGYMRRFASAESVFRDAVASESTITN